MTMPKGFGLNAGALEFTRNSESGGGTTWAKCQPEVALPEKTHSIFYIPAVQSSESYQLRHTAGVDKQFGEVIVRHIIK